MNNKKRFGKMGCLLIIFMLIFSLCACSKSENNQSGQSNSGNENTAGDITGNNQNENNVNDNITNDKSGDNNQQTDNSKDSLNSSGDNSQIISDDDLIEKSYIMPASATVDDYKDAALLLKNYNLDIDQSYKEFIDGVEEARNNGADALNEGMTILAEYFFNYSGASVSSVRYAVDNILLDKGAELSSEAQFNNWNDIISISYANPAAYYMNSICEKAKGNTGKVNELYELYKLNEENAPAGLKLFDGLSEMSVDELLKLREKLMEYETYIYEISPVAPTGWEACGYEFMEEFYIAAISYCLNTQDYSSELAYSLGLLRINPLDIENYRLAAVNAMEVSDTETAWYIIQSSLPLDKNGTMFTLGAALWYTSGSDEMAQDLIDVALSLEISEEDRNMCELIQKNIKEGK